jgi:hypothetical protein
MGPRRGVAPEKQGFPIMNSRKRKIAVLATIVSLALFTVVYGLAFPTSALAWDDCPKGLVNDPYPGACRRYVDTNGDGICDLSQSKPSDTTTTTALAVTTTTSGTPPTGDCPLGPCSGCGACLSGGITATATADNSSDASTAALAAAGGSAVVLSSTDSSTTTTTESGLPASEAASASVAVASAAGGGFITHYLVSPLALGFLFIYGASFYLYKTKRIRVTTHRKIWNALLLGTFLITGIFGTILAVQLDYALPFTLPVNLLFWHVEAGIVMTFISLFHMGWHFKYYKNMVKNAREKMRALRTAEREFAIDDRQLVLEAREARRSQRDARRIEREARVTRRANAGANSHGAQTEWTGAPLIDFELE